MKPRQWPTKPPRRPPPSPRRAATPTEASRLRDEYAVRMGEALSRVAELRMQERAVDQAGDVVPYLEVKRRREAAERAAMHLFARLTAQAQATAEEAFK